MRIAFPYTGYWPYVRRGVERCTHDLATYLASRGHQVHVITSTPGRPRQAWDGDVRVTYLRQLNHPLFYHYMPRFRVDDYAFQATRILLREKPDVTHLWSYSGLRWAGLLRALRRFPYVFQVAAYWPAGKGRMWFPELRPANSVLALNHDAAERVTTEFGVPCGVLPPPVDMAVFRPTRDPDLEHPRVFFPADLADPRKGGTLLLRAWNQVHRECPRAVLVLGGSLGVAGWLQDHGGVSTLSRLNLVADEAARAAIDLRGPGALDSVPDWYSQAAVTVLPSVEEAFGMVLTESLACGTPVVASRHCGPGEILGDPEIGVGVDLRDESDLTSRRRAGELAGAILAAIELARRPATGARCREWAARWSLERLGPRCEQVLESAASGGPALFEDFMDDPSEASA